MWLFLHMTKVTCLHSHNFMKITYFNKEIWWQWAWNFWRVGIEVDFDIRKYHKYFSLELYLLLFAIRLYFEWK